MQQMFLTYAEIHNSQTHLTIHNLSCSLSSTTPNPRRMFDLGFQNEAKTQNQMSKMQNPNLGFFFFQILPFFLDVNVEFLKIKYYLF